MRPPTIEEVEAAVRAVLSARSAGSRREESGPTFEGRLLSLKQAEILAARGRTIRVAPGTILTPLARDFLKQRGIAIRWVSIGEIARSSREGEWGFVAEAEGGTIDALRRLLLQQAEAWHDLGGDPMSAVRWVEEGEGRGAVVVTEEAAAVAWRANRVAGLRAAQAGDAEGVARAARSLGANLLVVEASGKSVFELRNLFAVFRRFGPPAAPAWLDAAGPAGVDQHADRRGHRPGDALPAASRPQERAAARGAADAEGGLAGGRPRAW